MISGVSRVDIIVLEVSKINAADRKQQKYSYDGGARLFIHNAMKSYNEGKSLSVLDNWKKLHKDGENWINDVAKEKQEDMTKMKNMVREKMIQEALEDTPPDSIVVDMDAQF
ncbi:hypothetical protein LguiA_005125 [Lonicera macranthoides]